MYLSRYRAYLLVGDEPAVISEILNQSAVEWFSEGFTKYFIVYPEWFIAVTNFSRPMMNLIPYLEYQIFGNNFSLYYVPFFCLQLCGALVVSYFLRMASVPVYMSYLFLFLFLINPAFVNFDLVIIPYQFDVVASIFALFAFFALWKSRHILAMLCLFLAVFTKETALFAPVAAAATEIIWRKNLFRSALMLVPLVVWGFLRWATFGALTGGTYAMGPGFWGLVAGVFKGALIWPTGIVAAPNGLLSLFRSGLDAPVLSFYTVIILSNLLLWVFILYYAVLIAGRLISEKGQSSDPALVSGLFFWALGALGFCVGLGLENRYGASAYAFLLLFLAVVLFGERQPSFPKWVSSSIVLLLISACACNLTQFFTVDQIAFSAGVDRQRALYEALRTVPQDRETVYVVNAPGELGSSPKYLESAWHIAVNVVFINQILGCLTAPDSIGTSVEFSGGTLIIDIPPCATYKFSNTNDKIVAASIEGDLDRPSVGIYNFPKGRIRGHWFNNPQTPNVDFGSLLRVTLYNPSVKILAYDWATSRYTILSRLGSASQ